VSEHRDEPSGEQPPTHHPYGAQPPPGPVYGQQPPIYGQQPPVPGQQPPVWGQPPAYGAPQYPVHPAYTTRQNDGLAVPAMVVGIVSLVLACGYGIGLLGAPAALFMGRASIKRIDASQGQLGGREMAMAGFVMGIVGTVLLVLALLALAVVIVGIATDGFS
jgi:hypothetical protein